MYNVNLCVYIKWSRPMVPFENRPSKFLIFECFRFSIVWYSDHDCIIIRTTNHSINWWKFVPEFRTRPLFGSLLKYKCKLSFSNETVLRYWCTRIWGFDIEVLLVILVHQILGNDNRFCCYQCFSRVHNGLKKRNSATRVCVSVLDIFLFSESLILPFLE